MRYLIPLAVLTVAQIGAAWAIGDNNVARPGGSYATVEADTAVACERLCADDTLCMAWSYQANSCELKAIVPAATERQGVTSGVSLRAPTSMRVRYEAPVATPVITAHEDEPALPAAEATPHQDIELALLGGPEPGGDLRGGLGN
ncbi:MAG: PAN/Apple domain-containing protein [Alphaproteobacteria bacterium]|nr:PAN/Apple domain-containing protein [Alphaproteobacteria bacterium]